LPETHLTDVDLSFQYAVVIARRINVSGSGDRTYTNYSVIQKAEWK